MGCPVVKTLVKEEKLFSEFNLGKNFPFERMASRVTTFLHGKKTGAQFHSPSASQRTTSQAASARKASWATALSPAYLKVSMLKPTR